ncbi:MAG: S-methyl-5'-thioinosine phosphorylase [Wenzhouxiangellaceae bacterium]
MADAFGLIAGTGFTDWLDSERKHLVNTPYGDMSAAVIEARLGSSKVFYLGRHGIPHTLAPHLVNYRANLWGLRELGIHHVIAINVVGSVHRHWPGGSLVVADQIIDYTHGREHTYYDGVTRDASEPRPVQHAAFTEPYDQALRERLLAAGRSAGLELVDGGVYAATQGPRLETAAEVRRIIGDGGELIGMTGMPEASLARELGMRYASLCLVSNLAAGIGDEDLSIAEIMATVQASAERVRRLLAAIDLSALPASNLLPATDRSQLCQSVD